MKKPTSCYSLDISAVLQPAANPGADRAVFWTNHNQHIFYRGLWVKGGKYMACPICKSNQFFLKDPSDPFEIYEFKYQNGEAQFDEAAIEDDAPDVSPDREIYCQRCSWHGKIDTVT